MSAADYAIGSTHLDDGPIPSPRVAVLIPCYNEEVAIASVIADFRAALPHAIIYVYDNNSRDQTAEVARAAGAVVGCEMLQGKGNVIRRMFADVEADIYVLVDGDATYHADSAPAMVDLLLRDRLDMVNGTRVSQIEGRIPTRPPLRQLDADRSGAEDLRRPGSPTCCPATACSRAAS